MIVALASGEGVPNPMDAVWLVFTYRDESLSQPKQISMLFGISL